MHRFRPLAVALLFGLLGPALPGTAHAQITLRGGVDLADFFGADAGSTERKSDLGFGGAFQLARFGPLNVVAEGYYRRKGAASVLEFQDALLNGQDAEVGIDYVEVPVLLRLDLPVLAGGRMLPYLNGGPAFAWRIDCSVRYSASGETAQNCDDLSNGNLEETLRDYEQGLVLGGGVDLFVLGPLGALNLDARLTRGLSRIAREGEDGEVKNRVFSLMLGYRIGTGGGGMR